MSDSHFVVDTATGIVYYFGHKVSLSPMEKLLLTTLLSHQDVILSREQLLELIWRDRPDVTTSAVAKTLSRLRQKLMTRKRPDPIVLFSGQGYALVRLGSAVRGASPANWRGKAPSARGARVRSARPT
ncbi:MAG: winged helix-turn-helix transcriptional regulator [Hyphomicrobium sp.]|nr:winged helix-turn-helix transcriptional regulator [Hyphomicrobium sp.]